MACCESKGCCPPKEVSKPSTLPTVSTGPLRMSSSRSIDSGVSSFAGISRAAESTVNGTSNVLSMLPVGKSCCAQDMEAGGGGGGCGGGGGGGGGMNETSNVLVQYTLSDLDRRSEINFWLGLICLGVCATNSVLLYLNWATHNCHPPPEVDKRTFHLLEFWTNCVYSIAETFALVMSPKTMLHIYNKPNLLKLLLFFNVVNSTIPALLMTLDFEFFELLSHELEFINSFTLSFITMVLVASLLNPPSLDEEGIMIPTNYSKDEDNQDDKASILMGGMACLVAASNFVVYNAGYHQAAHYLEFSFNILISLVTFWFCMDNRFMSQMEIGQILYGRHANCIFCQIRTNDLQAQMQASSKYQHMFGESISNEISVFPGVRGALGMDESMAARRRSSRLGVLNDEEMQVITEKTPLINGAGTNGKSNKTPSGKVRTIISEQHFRTKLQQSTVVVVMMSAGWCKLCEKAEPAFAKLAKKYAREATFCSVDVDDLDALAEEYDVTSTPTFLIFEKGEMMYSREGAECWESGLKEALSCVLG